MNDTTLVYDVTLETERWVKSKYVQLYPKLYLPVWVGTERIYRKRKTSRKALLLNDLVQGGRAAFIVTPLIPTTYDNIANAVPNHVRNTLQHCKETFSGLAY